MTIPKKLFAFLKALPTILGCLVLLVSIILPFYYLDTFTIDGPYRVTYWSFKADSFVFTTRFISQHFLFFNYWFYYALVGQAMSWILLPMFIFQLLTLTLGVASFFVNNRIILIAPFFMCLAVLSLMSLSKGLLEGTYQLGYYLVFPSLALFLYSFLLNEVTRRR